MNIGILQSSNEPPVTLVFRVTGLRCVACDMSIERVVERIEGVTRVSVHRASERLFVECARTAASERLNEQIEAAVRRAGFDIAMGKEAKSSLDEDVIFLAIQGFFGMQQMLLSITTWMEGDSLARSTRYALDIAVLATASVAVFVGGYPLFRRAAVTAIQVLRDRKVFSDPGSRRVGTTVSLSAAIGMDFSIAAGALVALLQGLRSVLHHSHALYADTATGIIFFALLGRVLEGRARRSATAGIRGLLDLVPPLARVVAGDGSTALLPADVVRTGDRVETRGNERVAFDGAVERGTASVDESWLTGEWKPRPVSVGSDIAAGARVLEGALVVRVRAVVGERQVDELQHAVDRFLAEKQPLEQLADRVARRFSLGLALLSVATLVVSRFVVSPDVALDRALAVLVVGCPCALGLASPLAATVAAAYAARRGILFRDPGVLEVLGNVRSMLFDKTGTVTEGCPALASVDAADSTKGRADALLAIAADAEVGSQHPFARAILAHTPRAEDTAGGTRTVHAGAGIVHDRADGRRVHVGSLAWLRTISRDLPVEAHDTALGVLVDGAYWGSVRFDDEPRPGVAQALGVLRDRVGLANVVLATGDTVGSAERLAARIGFHGRVEAGQTPDEKAALLDLLPRPSLAIGDGSNDAPVLSRADVSIAVGNPSASAIRASSVTLLWGGLERVPEVFDVARRATHLLKGNLLWAFGYNVVAIPAAMLGAVPPVVAAGLMAISSMTVVVRSGWAFRGRAVP